MVKPEWYVFTMIDLDTHQRLPLHKMQELCQLLKLKMVPVEEEKVVIRPIEPVYSKVIEGPLSMKVLNNDCLLKE